MDQDDVERESRQLVLMRDRFMVEWSVLEIAYAGALDRGTPLPTATNDFQVREALDALDTLLDERVKDRA